MISLSADFFKKKIPKSLFRNTIRMSNPLDPNQARLSSGLIWIQSVYKENHSTPVKSLCCVLEEDYLSAALAA